MSRRTLVTGATGFVGGRLARALVERGERVRVLARPGSSLRGLEGVEVEVAEGDIRVEHTVYRALAGCDRVYHCAAVFTLWAERPTEIMSAAVDGTISVLRAARGRGVERVVYTSTAYTIGTPTDREPMDETHEWRDPPGPYYAIAKRRAEEAALEFADAKRLPLVVVNPGGVFGPGDWKPTPSGQGILDVITSPSLPGLGTLVPRAPGGLNVIDVDDVAAGHIAAMDRGRDGERYLLTGDNLSLVDFFGSLTQLVGRPAPRLSANKPTALATAALLTAIARLTGTPPKLSLETVRGTFGHHFYFSNEKARRELGFAPRPARVALARSIRFFVDNGFVPPRIVRRMRLDPTAMAAA